MGQSSVAINPSGDRSGDIHSSLRAGAALAAAVVVSSKASVLISKKGSQPCRCQFCGRECRNAQALGGHMNVHRREKATAKQLLELRTTTGSHGVRDGIVQGTAGVSAGAAAAASDTVILAVGSSSSSTSPPSAQASQAWRPLHQLPHEDDDLDLELRLGITPENFL